MRTINFTTNRIKAIQFLLIASAIFATSAVTFGQASCDGTVPTYVVDLTGQPNGTYISPPDIRVGNCCGTTAPDNCIQFIVTLDSMSNGIIFSIASGAIPPGAIFYQVNCGPPTPVGSTLCLIGIGPHYLTFCKPGNNTNSYQITSLSQPQSGPDVSTTAGCTQPLYVNGLDATSTTWTSVFPGPNGAYNSYLSCTSGCDSVTVTPGPGAPAYVDYLVCGFVYGGCFPFTYCDTLRVNIAPDLTSVNTNIPCFGGVTGAVDLLAAGGPAPVSYFWTNGSITEDISGLSAGTYGVTVTNGNGCTRTFSTTITEPAILSVTSTSSNVNCFGGADGSINITPSGGTSGYSYTWNNGSNTEDLYGLNSGTYSTTITDANGCTLTYSATITQPLAPITISGNPTHVLCYGGNSGAIDINIAGGTPGYTYTWNNGSIVEDINGLVAGMYSVIVTDANGCTNNSYSVSITQPTPLSINSQAYDPNCNGEYTGSIDIDVSGGLPPYYYSWSNGSTEQDIINLNAGTYSIEITDENGCSLNDNWNLLDPSILNIDPIIQPSTCYGINDASITLNISGGTSPYQAAWNNGSNSYALEHLGPGNYAVIVTDNNGCTISGNYLINPTPVIHINLDSLYTIWLGETVELQALASGGTGALTYSWSPPEYLSCTDCSVTNASPILNTTYAVTVTDANGCTANADAYIEILFALFVPNSFTPNGDGDNDQFFAFSSSVKNFNLRIFDRWGEEIFTSNNIHDGWDGIYKGGEIKQDVYVYRIEATFLNGKQQELIGQVNLIR